MRDMRQLLKNKRTTREKMMALGGGQTPVGFVGLQIW